MIYIRMAPDFSVGCIISLIHPATTSPAMYGTWGNQLNALYFFFNPSIQGTTRTMQALRDSKQVRYIASTIGMTGVSIGMINLSLSTRCERLRSPRFRLVLPSCREA